MLAPPSDTHDVLVSFFATLIAGSALIVSFSQSYFAQRHYKLSTQPALSIGTAAKQLESRFAGEDEEGIYVRNKGLGPARIRSMDFFLDKTLVKQPAGQSDEEFFALEAIVKDLVTAGVIQSPETVAPKEGDFIKESDQIKFLAIKSGDVLKRTEWLAFLDRRLAIAITYCSIYEECWTACYRMKGLPGEKACR